MRWPARYAACMPEPPLPVDDRHRDVRGQVFAVVPQRRAPLGKRAFWRLVLAVARFPGALRLLRRTR
jgi:hypothetical protein